MSMPSKEYRATSDEANLAISTYLDNLLKKAGQSAPSTKWKKNRSSAFVPTSSTQQVAKLEQIAAGLREDLVTAQAAATVATTQAGTQQARITQLEARLAAQTITAQATIRGARWRWTQGGFLGGCFILLGLIGAFLLYFQAL
jgi:hypothetical protein